MLVIDVHSWLVIIALSGNISSISVKLQISQMFRQPEWCTKYERLTLMFACIQMKNAQAFNFLSRLLDYKPFVALGPKNRSKMSRKVRQIFRDNVRQSKLASQI